MQDQRWREYPSMHPRVLALAADNVASATRAPNYDAEFQSFLRAFGSVFDVAD